MYENATMKRWLSGKNACEFEITVKNNCEFENPKPMLKTKQNKKSQAFFLFVILVLLQQNGKWIKGES